MHLYLKKIYIFCLGAEILIFIFGKLNSSGIEINESDCDKPEKLHKKHSHQFR